jgi:hypothetical protein
VKYVAKIALFGVLVCGVSACAQTEQTSVESKTKPPEKQEAQQGAVHQPARAGHIKPGSDKEW